MSTERTCIATCVIVDQLFTINRIMGFKSFLQDHTINLLTTWLLPSLLKNYKVSETKSTSFIVNRVKLTWHDGILVIKVVQHLIQDRIHNPWSRSPTNQSLSMPDIIVRVSACIQLKLEGIGQEKDFNSWWSMQVFEYQDSMEASIIKKKISYTDMINTCLNGAHHVSSRQPLNMQCFTKRVVNVTFKSLL